MSKEKKAGSKQTKRKKEKYPYLKKNLNLKSRRDYLPTHYVNGVPAISGEKGAEGIRGMNDDEKEWLNQFNKEFVGASFSEDQEKNLQQNTPEEVERIAEIIAEVKGLKNDIKRIDMTSKKYSPEMIEIYERLHELEEERLSIDFKKASYDANNDRNRCVMNIGKMTGRLKLRTWGELDEALMSLEDFDDYQDLMFYYNIQLKEEK
jgi:hypothetical protein